MNTDLKTIADESCPIVQPTKSKRERITKGEFLRKGAYSNPKLYMSQTKAGRRSYWRIID